MGTRTTIEHFCDWCCYVPPEDASQYIKIQYSCHLNGYGYGNGTKDDLCRNCFELIIGLRKSIINKAARKDQP